MDNANYLMYFILIFYPDFDEKFSVREEERNRHGGNGSKKNGRPVNHPPGWFNRKAGVKLQGPDTLPHL